MNRRDINKRPTDKDMAADVYNQGITVPFGYPVHFCRDVFAPDNPLLASVLNRLGEDRVHRAAVYVDSGVADASPDLINDIQEYFHARHGQIELAGPPQIVPGGESAKTDWDIVRNVMWTIGNLHLDRQSFVIAIGGGAMLDMVGFATSIVHRGLRLVRLPSTTLAQNDAGIGVKNGMNEHGMKNFVGTFAPPFAVLNDFSFLATLSFKDWIGGIAEAFKVAIIKDSDFFDSLCENADALKNRDQRSMEDAVTRCALVHLEHIRTGGDPFELGSARPLDFGHWAGHKLEVSSNYTIGHGQAVSIGLALDSYYAFRQNLLTQDEYGRIIDGLSRCGLPTWSDHLAERTPEGELAILDGLVQFREHLGGALTITLPDGIGSRVEVHHMNPDLIESAVEHLRSKHRKESR